MIQLFDLALKDEAVRPSPYCWMVKFALLHKGLAFETRTVPFADKSKYPDPDYGKVPVLSCDGELVRDSQAIARWLDRKFPQNPLAGSKAEWAAAEFYLAWAGANLFPPIGRLIVLKILEHARDDDKDYFRSSREARFGGPLEAYASTPGAGQAIENALTVLGKPLENSRYLGGAAPSLFDYIVFSAFMWQRSVTLAELYETPAAVIAWRERMLDLFGGYARNAKCAEAK
ncbi:MAG: glutathione S-transferase N-terminal domain-containing protein [Parvularculaceae bacterium]|nr:glutathione S-transferase N-terminal domain-containing protein [Parvularculaceae bacterium]